MGTENSQRLIMPLEFMAKANRIRLFETSKRLNLWVPVMQRSEDSRQQRRQWRKQEKEGKCRKLLVVEEPPIGVLLKSEWSTKYRTFITHAHANTHAPKCSRNLETWRPLLVHCHTSNTYIPWGITLESIESTQNVKPRAG